MTIITGSSGIGALTFINSQLGVAIFVGLAFATICFTALFICKNLNQNKNTKAIQVRDFDLSKQPVNKITDHDIGYMLGGHFKNNIFKFDGGGKILEKYPNKINNTGYIRLHIKCVPHSTKNINLFFSLAPNIKDKCSFFIKDGNNEVSVNKYSQVIEKVPLNNDGDMFNFKFVEFRVEYTQEFDKDLWKPSCLEILIQQFEL